MNKPITIAVDAMGGDNSPEKVVKGIALHSSKSEDVFYKIFGDENLLNPLINKLLKKKNYQIFHTDKKISNEDTALTAVKRGKQTSMWLAVESVKKKSQILSFQLAIQVHCLS